MARPLHGPNGEEIISVRFNPAGLAKLVQETRDIEKKFLAATGKGGFIEHTNVRSLHFIQKKAVDNLQKSIAKNRRPDFQSHKLEKAILDDKYSSADAENIEFLIRSRIFPDVPYYASLEYGDDSQVGKERYFTLLGVQSDPASPNLRTDHRRNFNREHLPSAVRNNRTPANLRENFDDRPRSVVFSHPQGVSDRLIGPREYQARLGLSNEFSARGRIPIVIRRPVPRYEYGQKAADFFLSTQEYKRILREEVASFLDATGIKLT